MDKIKHTAIFFIWPHRLQEPHVFSQLVCIVSRFCVSIGNKNTLGDSGERPSNLDAAWGAAKRIATFSLVEKSIASYRQCSAGRVWPAKDFGASIVDTAICTKPGEVLAGQLLYGDSIHRSYFVLT
ncbi:hypothetical protein [Edaphobacter aggregans]|uniref:hypothetical protein n=1 Tax=Edaphobacter aggregans TaxID=570835 RepID=UPI0012FAC5D6|nr:hypothetical protein [Edaphobacter aggregans]